MNRPERSFHIGDVLSITTGVLLSPRGLNGVSDILSHMTGEELSLFELSSAAQVCAPILRAEFPQLAMEAVPEFEHSSSALEYVKTLEWTYGTSVKVKAVDQLPVWDSGL